jgi:hypothetical protein
LKAVDGFLNGATQIHADLRKADLHGQPLGIHALQPGML